MDYTSDYINYNEKPLRIICLTEESVETLFEIGAGELIVGVSSYVKRPDAATKIQKVSMFTSSNIKKIKELKPDLVLGFSDIQKDIAKELITEGIDVWIANHRNLKDMFRYIRTLSLMVDKKTEGEKLLERLSIKINEAISFSQTLKEKPKIYFEEWDDPLISAITWVSEIIELCGGVNIFKENSTAILAKDRFVSHDKVIEKNPDIILACHCGKKVKLDKIRQRVGYGSVKAIRDEFVFELEPEIFLQPGPAVIIDGIDQLITILKKWSLK
jgi:iron complex transport system substrate-binding protein